MRAHGLRSGRSQSMSIKADNAVTSMALNSGHAEARLSDCTRRAALASFAVYRSPSMSLSAVSAKSKADDEKAWHGQREYPPLVFTSRAWLDCSISSTKPGRQAMCTTNGQGFNFDMEMMPIEDGLV